MNQINIKFPKAVSTLEPPKPVDMVAGMFPRDNVSVLAARAGAGKSMFCVWLTRDLSRGGVILQGQTICKPIRVMYFAGESGSDLIVSRFHKLDPKPDFNNVILYSLIGMMKENFTPYIDDVNVAQTIGNLASLLKVDMIIFDSLMAFKSGDENSSKEIMPVMTNLKRIAEFSHTAVLVTHHLRKKDRRNPVESLDQDEIIGSSAIVRSVSMAYIMEGNENKIIKNVKSWWETPQPFVFSIVPTDIGIGFKRQIDLIENATTKRLSIENYILKLKNVNFSSKDIAEAMQCDVRTVQRTLSSMGKLIRPVSKGVYTLNLGENTDLS